MMTYPNPAPDRGTREDTLIITRQPGGCVCVCESASVAEWEGSSWLMIQSEDIKKSAEIMFFHT